MPVGVSRETRSWFLVKREFFLATAYLVGQALGFYLCNAPGNNVIVNAATQIKLNLIKLPSTL